MAKTEIVILTVMANKSILKIILKKPDILKELIMVVSFLDIDYKLKFQIKLMFFFNNFLYN